jgi:hypothetical protein
MNLNFLSLDALPYKLKNKDSSFSIMYKDIKKKVEKVVEVENEIKKRR